MYIHDSSWKTFELIENAGARIHDVIHKHNPKRNPPILRTSREKDDVLILRYQSHCKLCPVVRGIVRGLGEKYGERFQIDETKCMYQGAPECVFRITRQLTDPSYPSTATEQSGSPAS